MKIFLAFIFTLLVTASAAKASGDLVVTLTVDRTRLAVDESVELTVQVGGSRRAPRPEIIGLEQFNVEGQNESSQVQIINGDMSSSTNFIYTLTPKQSGDLSIGPATVTVDGKIFKSLPVTLHVTAAAERAPEDLPFRITAEVNQLSPYVNQGVVYTFRLYTRAAIANAQLKLPEFEGFWKEQIGKQEEFRENSNGVDWEVTQIRFALFPTQPGPQTIAPAQLGLDVAVANRGRRSVFDNGLFGMPTQTRHVNLTTKAVELKVNALPTEGRPPNFSGLVGQFSIEAHLATPSMAFGDSNTLKVTVTGTGNIHDAALGTLSFPDIKIYEDKPTLEAKVTGGHYGGNKLFTMALVPQKLGTLTLGPIGIDYFDAETRRYLHATTASLAINVLPGANGEKESLSHVGGKGTGPTKQEIKILGSDLMPPKTESLRQDSLTEKQRLALVAIVAISGLTYMAALALRRRRERNSNDAGARKRDKAFQIFRNSLKTLKDGPSFYQDASHLLRNFLGDRFSWDGAALTAADLGRKLPERGISKDTVSGLVNILAECDAAIYGGGANTQDKAAFKDGLLELAKHVQKEGR